MLTFPQINPILISIGPLDIHWYSLAYIAGILLGYKYAKLLNNRFKLGINNKLLEDFITYAIIGIILGGRLFYVLFYDPMKYLANPIEIFKTYEGGMSFHGGFIGVVIACYTFCYKKKINFLLFTDILSIIAPIGLFFGRIANFINGELYGKITDVPWAMIFPYSDMQPRHPSQLYEAFFEGLVLFCLMYYLAFKRWALNKRGFCSAIFLMGYSISRIIIELFREPDSHIGYFYNYLSMGQILCLPMLLGGIYLLFKIKCQQATSIK